MSARTLPRPAKKSTLCFGPLDHGRLVSQREIDTAEYTLGFKYEIIDGRLYVSPQPNLPANYLENWLRRAVERYSDDHPDVINYVTSKGRVFLPEAVRLTVPEPDLAAYANFTLPTDDDPAWPNVSPILVCEILVEGSIEKDLDRNPRLYLQVPSIREYWIVDGTINWRKPSLLQYVRRSKKWSITTHAFGSTFTPKLLPNFSLIINPCLV